MQNGNQYTDYPVPAGGGTQLPPISTSLGRPPPPRMVAPPPPTVKQQHPYSFGFHSSSATENAQTQPELYTEVPRFYPGPSALHHLHQRQRQQQQLHQPPVKLLQSCDSCRRRKIRCSGEKPMCSSCIRYQEVCHYSPLATPRRRAGKKIKTTSSATPIESPRIHPPPSRLQQHNTEDASRSVEPSEAPSGSGAATEDGAAWSTEASQMRREIQGLASKVDQLSGKLDQLLGLAGHKRPHANSVSEYDEEEDEEQRASTAPSDPMAGLDPVDQRSIEAVMNMSETGLEDHLIDTFYANAEINIVAVVPRKMFDRLRREGRVPTSMLNVMLADACRFSNHPSLEGTGTNKMGVRNRFIERAYKSLFECLEYDSVEHCVALLLFAMIISQAGLNRAWIMHSLSSQMAIRLRFHALDSPMSTAMFRDDSPVDLEWKRRVFWQLYTYDVMTSTLSDLPQCLSIHDVQCNAPTPLDEKLLNNDKSGLAMLGPALVMSDDQDMITQQIDILAIIYDISIMQCRLNPENEMFPAEFQVIYKRVEEWQDKLPWFKVLAHGTNEEIDSTFAQAPGRLFLGLMCEYAVLFMCMIKDTWLPSARAMTAKEEETLVWARSQAVVSARLVHRVVPLIRRTQLRVINPFVSCIVFQACIVSMYSCAWQSDPKHTMDAIDHVQNGLEYLEYVTPRWGFASVMSMSLRTLIVDRGFSSGGEQRGRKDKSETDNPAAAIAKAVDRMHMSARREKEPHPERPFMPTPHFDIYHAMGQTKLHQMQDAAIPGDPIPEDDEAAQWERILRTSSIPDANNH